MPTVTDASRSSSGLQVRVTSPSSLPQFSYGSTNERVEQSAVVCCGFAMAESSRCRNGVAALKKGSRGCSWIMIGESTAQMNVTPATEIKYTSGLDFVQGWRQGVSMLFN